MWSEKINLAPSVQISFLNLISMMVINSVVHSDYCNSYISTAIIFWMNFAKLFSLQWQKYDTITMNNKIYLSGWLDMKKNGYDSSVIEWVVDSIDEVNSPLMFHSYAYVSGLLRIRFTKTGRVKKSLTHFLPLTTGCSNHKSWLNFIL